MLTRENSIKGKDIRLKLNEISSLSSIETNGALMCKKEDLQKMLSRTRPFESYRGAESLVRYTV